MDAAEMRRRSELACRALNLNPHTPCGGLETADALALALWGVLPGADVDPFAPKAKAPEKKGGGQ